MNEWHYFFLRVLFLVISMFYPSRPRRSVRFGVVIPPGQDADAALLRIVKKYRYACGSAGALLLAAEVLLIRLQAISPVAALVYLFPLSWLVSFALYARAVRAVYRWKKEQGRDSGAGLHPAEAVSSRKSAALSRWHYLFYCLYIAANMTVISFFHDQIPGQFSYFTRTGEMDHVTVKSDGIVYLMNVIQAFFVAIMIGIMESIHRSKEKTPSFRVNVKKLKEEDHQEVRRRALMISHITTWVIVVVFTVLQLSMLQIIASNIRWIVEAVGVAVLGIALLLGVNGKKKAASKMSGAEGKWVLGIVYVNRHDPAILAEKPGGSGYGVNLGRMGGWAVVLLPLLFAGMMAGYSWR